MAMSRSLGGSWFTTRPPIEISPPLICSSPAIMRNSVDLPQPDGPTSTTNSSSPMSMSMPWITSTGPKDFLTPRISTPAIDATSHARSLAGRPCCRPQNDGRRAELPDPSRRHGHATFLAAFFAPIDFVAPAGAVELAVENIDDVIAFARGDAVPLGEWRYRREIEIPRERATTQQAWQRRQEESFPEAHGSAQ